MRYIETLVIGQGIAGSAVAWTLHQVGEDVFIVDRPVSETSSRIAAGLVTPVTGKHLARSRDYDALYYAAVKFYRSVEETVGTELFGIRPSVRLLDDATSRAFFARPDMPGVKPWNGRLQEGGPAVRGFEMSPAARLDVQTYLDETRAFFEDAGRFAEADLPPSDIEITDEAVRVPKLSLSADRVVFCTGPAATSVFPSVPNDPARGDVLRVRIPDYRPGFVLHFGHWVVPNGDGTQTVGATFDWKEPSEAATAAGRERLVESLESQFAGPIEALDVRSAVRPTMRDHRPVVGCHPERPRAFILNGLGAKGVLRGPTMAAHLARLLKDGTQPPRTVRYERLVEAESAPRPLTASAQYVVREVVRPGETVVDATVGNGFDTCFLAETVGDAGRVIGFDVQDAAIEGTRRRLEFGGLRNVSLHCESHAEISQRVVGPIAAAMFNLGYLPRGDHSIVTRPESTLTALRAAVSLLRPGGVATVLCYRGHDGGPEEAAAVSELLSSYVDEYAVERIESTPPKESSPVLYVVRRRGTENVVSGTGR